MPVLLNPPTSAPAAGLRPRHEVADIFRQYGPDYQQSQVLPLLHQQVMQAIAACRTAVLGGHLEACDRCGFQRPVYNSCRNRHCPKCQTLAKLRWLEARQAELLPVGYFHTVFTLPHELNDLALANPRRIYDLLFQSVAQTLLEFAADPRHRLAGQPGFTAVLHTWDQQLRYHVHLHCLVAGGALSWDGQRWVAARRNFLFPVRALSRVFRGKFLDFLSKAFRQGQLNFPGKFGPLQTPSGFQELLTRLRSKEWVVYAKKPFGGPEVVLDYLGRYTHRVAIANSRLRDIADGRVTFAYRDRRDHNQVKETTVSADEFIRRFLQHVLPRGFCRIRHFGFLGNRVKRQQLQRCRELLLPEAETKQPAVLPVAYRDLVQQVTGIDLSVCPQCQGGTMRIRERLPARSELRKMPAAASVSINSS